MVSEMANQSRKREHREKNEIMMQINGNRSAYAYGRPFDIQLSEMAGWNKIKTYLSISD